MGPRRSSRDHWSPARNWRSYSRRRESDNLGQRQDLRQRSRSPARRHQLVSDQDSTRERPRWHAPYLNRDLDAQEATVTAVNTESLNYDEEEEPPKQQRELFTNVEAPKASFTWGKPINDAEYIANVVLAQQPIQTPMPMIASTSEVVHNNNDSDGVRKQRKGKKKRRTREEERKEPRTASQLEQTQVSTDLPGDSAPKQDSLPLLPPEARSALDTTPVPPECIHNAYISNPTARLECTRSNFTATKTGEPWANRMTWHRGFDRSHSFRAGDLQNIFNGTLLNMQARYGQQATPLHVTWLAAMEEVRGGAQEWAHREFYIWVWGSVSADFFLFNNDWERRIWAARLVKLMTASPEPVKGKICSAIIEEAVELGLMDLENPGENRMMSIALEMITEADIIGYVERFL